MARAMHVIRDACYFVASYQNFVFLLIYFLVQ
jgi:hypothetical protein